MQRFKWCGNKNEKGELMIEGMIVTIITTFMLLWLLAIGFIYYQRYTTTIIVNDATAKIASTYNNPTSDLIMGYVTSEEVSGRNLYRNFKNSTALSDLKEVNEERAKKYILYKIHEADFSNAVKEVEVDLKYIADSNVRKHIEITAKCSYNTPFGQILDMFGMKKTSTYKVTSCADCTDILDYVSTVDYELAFSDGRFTKGTGLLDSAVKMINSFIKTYNHKHS